MTHHLVLLPPSLQIKILALEESSRHFYSFLSPSEPSICLSFSHLLVLISFFYFLLLLLSLILLSSQLLFQFNSRALNCCLTLKLCVWFQKYKLTLHVKKISLNLKKSVRF